MRINCRRVHCLYYKKVQFSIILIVKKIQRKTMGMDIDVGFTELISALEDIPTACNAIGPIFACVLGGGFQQEPWKTIV